MNHMFRGSLFRGPKFSLGWLLFAGFAGVALIALAPYVNEDSRWLLAAAAFLNGIMFGGEAVNYFHDRMRKLAEKLYSGQ